MKKKKKKPLGRKIIKILGWIFGIIILLAFLLIIFIRSPWGQNLIVQRAVKYVSEKTETKVEIEKLFITFDGNVMLKGLFLEDTQGDTLVYSKSLEADIPILPIIRGNGIAIDYLKWEGLKARVYRKDTIEGFNFQFLIDAFASDEETPIEKENTESEPMKLVIGDVLFSDFDLIFKDDIGGIDSELHLGHLSLHMKKTDLENMDFRASKIALSNTRAKFIQSPSLLPDDEEDEESPLPFLQVDKLTLDNVFAYYESEDELMKADLEIGEFLAELKKVDLNKNNFEVGTLELKKSIVRIDAKTEDNPVKETAEDAQEEVEKTVADFEWPDMEIAVSKINFEENHIGYFVNEQQPKKGIFDANALAVEDLNILINDVYLKDKTAGMDIKTITFKEASGLDLKELGLKLAVTDENLEIDNLKFQLNENKLTGEVGLEYATVNELIGHPDQSKLVINIPSLQVDVKDAFRFQPDLRKNEYIAQLSRKKLTGNLKINGYLSDLDIPGLTLRWGGNTRIATRVKIKNVTHPDQLQFNIPSFSAQSKRDDLIRFVNEEELGVGLPEDVLLKGYARGNMDDVYAKADLTTTQGIAVVEGHFKNTDEIAFDADLEIKEYKLNELLKNDQLGALSLTVKTSGSGKNINNLNAVLDANISSFQLGDYAIKDLSLTSEIIEGKGDLASKYKDENIDIDLTADIVLDSVSPLVDAFLDVKGINLQALGIMDRDVRTGLKLDVNFEGSEDGFDIISTMGDAVVIQEDETYLLGDMLATAHVRSDTTSIWLDNRILQFSIESNSDPAAFGKALQRHVSSYFSRQIQESDSAVNPVKLKMIGRVAQAPVLNQVFLKNVQDLDTIVFGAYFDENARRLIAEVHAPHINYSGNTLDSLAFKMNTDREKFMFDLSFKNIQAGPLDIPRTKIEGNQQDNKMNLVFNAVHNDSILTNIKSEITGTSEELHFHVLSEDLILNKNPWQIPRDNEIVWTPDKISMHNFKFSRNNESFELTDKIAGINNDHIAVDFQNFNLREIMNYLNPEEELVKGDLNGSFVLIDPLNELGLKSDLVIHNLNVMNVDLGKMTMDAESKSSDRYDFQIAVKEGHVDLDVKGNYITENKIGKPNINIDLNRVDMEALEGFSMGEIRNAKGSFAGKFKVSGTTDDLKYSGGMNFRDVEFNVAQLNATFGLQYESLRIDNEGLSLNRFTILDENKNQLVISGKIGTENFANPTFDLKIDTDDFQVLNASEKDNTFLYGVAAFDAHGTVKGNLNVPIVKMDIHIDDNTDITYVLPASTVGIEERDGVVVFVNREDPEAVLTNKKDESAIVTGFDLEMLLKIGEKAKIAIVIDKETGDNFEIYGDGDLNFTMKPNGRMTLTGIYDVGGGHYEMNLYNLVNRKFELAKGSKVTWAGDPLDAKLDIRAVYRLETSASPLMAPVSSGADPAEKGKFRQVLPFDVFLNVGGGLDKPEVSFNLDMPEDEQGAIGGQVYGRVQQVNQQEDELNRQIFSLLVLNRFYPDPGSDGSGGGIAAIARDNLNDAISDQLNMFSDKMFGDTGFKLDFGLDSYTDYQGDSPQQRTQLDIAAQQKLFDDRLIVRVGSEVDIEGSRPDNEPAPLIGNVSLEYLLTENGRYRLKGFRKNSYENVIDGQTIVSGMSVIFTQEFNEFNELWEAILRGETKEERAERRAAAAEKRKKERQQRRKDRLMQRNQMRPDRPDNRNRNRDNSSNKEENKKD